MTLKEITNTFSYSYIDTIVGQTIRDICLIAYGDDKQLYYDVLTLMNDRTDWDYLPSTRIFYIDKDTLNKYLN